MRRINGLCTSKACRSGRAKVLLTLVLCLPNILSGGAEVLLTLVLRLPHILVGGIYARLRASLRLHELVSGGAIVWLGGPRHDVGVLNARLLRGV